MVFEGGCVWGCVGGLPCPHARLLALAGARRQRRGLGCLEMGPGSWTANGHHATLLACLPCLQVIGEMRSGLADWEAVKRWDTLGISAQVADGSFNWSCS